MDRITFQIPDSDETAEFYVLEQTRIGGTDYILVAEEEDGDCDAFILKELTGGNPEEASYEMVENEEELAYMSKIFASMLEDVDITM